jgi:hypothetical protein
MCPNGNSVETLFSEVQWMILDNSNDANASGMKQRIRRTGNGAIARSESSTWRFSQTIGDKFSHHQCDVGGMTLRGFEP